MRQSFMGWFFVVLAVALLPVSQPAFGLAKEYERNGEVYVLVGDGPKVGVYRLNDPASEGVPTGWLYNPQASYGISVNLTRKVFTFSETIATAYSVLAGNIEVRLKPSGDNIMQGFHCEHRSSWSEAGWPMYTSPGTMSNYPGYYSATSTGYGYSMYRATGSCCGCGAPAGVPITFPVYVTTPNAAGYASIPNNSWYQSWDDDTHGRPGKCYRDRTEGKAHNYNLLEWYQGISGNTPADQGTKATSYEKKVQRALLGSCIDPCGTSNANLSMNAATQTVSLALSSFGRTYCYSRTETSTSDGKLTLDGANYGGALIGMMNDLSTKWVGVSLKSTTQDFVYVLGTEVIKQWFTALGFSIPAGFNVSAVSVSDQWYLTGGIVFAYNKSNGSAYQFTRTENADGTSGVTSYFTSVPLGNDVDDIKADGFGNLYFAKTAFFPVNGAGFTAGDAVGIQWTSVSLSSGKATGRIIYDQDVTKSVYRRALGATTFNLVGSVLLGEDKWERFFWVPLTLTSGQPYSVINHTNYVPFSSTADWHWIDAQPAKDPTPSVSLPSRVQVGVINVATPPKVYTGDASGVVDIVGPINNWSSSEVAQGLYTYRIENGPLWERDDWNTKYYDPNNLANAPDENGNGKIGCFASTVSKAGPSPSSTLSDHVLYEWVIYQVKDAYDNDITPAKIVKNSGSVTGIPQYTPNPDIMFYFTAGVYQIMCRAKYRYYNYNTLPYGSTVLDKPGCLTVFEEAVAPAKPTSVNTANYPSLAAIPVNSAVQMLKVNLQTAPASGTYRVDVYRKLPSDLLFSAPIVQGGYRFHAIDELATHVWKIATTTVANSPDDKLYNLPTITDSNKVGAVRWYDTVANYNWKFDLTLPDGSMYPLPLAPKYAATAADAPVEFFLPIPTDPKLASITCTAYRTWEYDYRAYWPDGTPKGILTQRGTITYTGTCRALIYDITPPTVLSVNSGALMGLTLHGSTGDPLSLAALSNPAALSVVVRDNNPFGNHNNQTVPCEVTGYSKFDRGVKQTSTFFHETNGSSKAGVPIQTLASFTRNAGVTTTQFHSTLTANAATNPATNVTIGSRVLTVGQMREIASYSCPGLTQLADGVNNNNYRVKRTLRSVPAGSTYSEVEYALNVADVQHFQGLTATQSTSVAYHANLPIGFANNATGYNGAGSGLWVNNGAHDGYSVTFVACDPSGNEMKTSSGLTFIDVVDNRHPILYLTITDLKTNVSTVVPQNISLYSGNYDFFKHVTTQLSTWEPGPDGVFTNFNQPFGTSIFGLPKPPLANMSGLTAIFPPEMEAGVEVDFTLTTSDNIAVATDNVPYFRVVGPKSGSLHFANGSTEVTVPAANVNQFRYVFRQPGVYEVSMQAEDTALDYSKSNHRNTRTCRFGLIIVPTTLDIRVIDRETNRR